MGCTLVSVLASWLRATNHDPLHGGECWVVVMGTVLQYRRALVLVFVIVICFGVGLLWVLLSSSSWSVGAVPRRVLVLIFTIVY